MSKYMKKSIILLLSLLVILMSIPAGMTQASYSYKVRVFAGNQAAAGYKGALVWQADFADGEECTLPLSLAEGTLESGSKYYVKGFKISGEGGESYCAAQSFIVDHDYDFIIAYGMPDKLVSYTIHFVDAETGEDIADPVTYFGNVGDKPVVAYEYVENYRPLYRNITGTLYEDGNVWSFPYLQIEREEYTAPAIETTEQEEPEQQETEEQEPQTDENGQLIESEEVTTEPQTDENGVVIESEEVPGNEEEEQENPQAPENPQEEEQEEAVNTPEEAGNEEENAPVAQEEADNPAAGNTGGIDLGGNAGVLTDPELYEFAETEDILDLDVPLAAPTVKNDDTKEGEDGEVVSETTAANAEGTTSAKGLSTPVIIIIVAACAVIIIIILLVVFRRKK